MILFYRYKEISCEKIYKLPSYITVAQEAAIYSRWYESKLTNHFLAIANINFNYTSRISKKLYSTFYNFGLNTVCKKIPRKIIFNKVYFTKYQIYINGRIYLPEASDIKTRKLYSLLSIL